MSAPRHIIIVGLRRSGTTALWKLFRQDPSYTCYDEPFGVRLRELPQDHAKGVRHEFITLFNRDPDLFRSVYAPIPRGQETTRGMTPAQRAYLGYLLGAGPVVVDVTRCHGKIADLHTQAPDAVLVHLYRKPAAFVTSHLLPSDRRDLLRIRGWWGRQVFFSKTGRFNRWGMEDLLTWPYGATTRTLLGDVGVQLPAPGAPAVQLLLAHWLGCYRIAEREGGALFRERFVSLSLERFCREPQPAIRRIRTLAGEEPLTLDCSSVRTPRSPFMESDKRWWEMAGEVGFTGDEIARYF